MGTFCVFPLTHLVVHNDGTYGPCCSAAERVFLNEENKVDTSKMYTVLVRDHAVVPYGLSIQEAFNSEFMQNIRQQLLNDEKPSACENCWKDEENGITSKRQQNNDLYLSLKPQFKGIFDYNKTELVDNMHIRSLDLKFSNKCNLHCLMCSSGNSDMWLPIDEKIDQYLTEQNLKPSNKHLSFSEKSTNTELYHSSDHFIPDDETLASLSAFPQERYEEIKSLIPQLQEIQCTGGEPFVSKQFIDLLEYAVETGHAHHISLEITTNGTKFVTDVMELLTHFKHIRFIISIDGTKGTYEYIRAPFKYSMLLERLTVLNEYMESGKINAMVNLATVGMSYNIFDYYNFEELSKSLNYRPNDDNNFTNLNMFVYNEDNPLHVKWLPSSLLHEALGYYTTLMNPAHRDRPGWYEQLHTYIKFNIPDQETKLHNQRRMKNYTILMDKMLNRDYHDFLDSRIVEFLDNVEADL